MVTYLGSLVHLCCGEGGTQQINISGVCAHSVWTTLMACAFQVYTAQTPGCSAGARSKVSPVFCALHKSKPLRFRLSGTPQGYRLCWACVLCPSQAQAAQVTRCLASTLSPGGMVRLITSPVPAAWFPGCAVGVPSQVCCVSPLGS